ncbi:1-deoxy-D-xylulose-5-phosphate reductoisomerase [Candidatus Anaplasma sp. TIGMIC]|uniref:1-deoxy-D-xylulose-5-phosphate reductoisomerase n=1 Tax=Candidatus Anaplasma sp. TIGMIC TaxID=3020713 RepID=UPI00232D7FB5|nr:1-deoxy-D-xylulose-5-phosphate reductoisomerase [Candidatus Anaplasma sp. TIGMIC]MDB1135159.1 1-deoxy-D-xylulose-5-phosphate reductoisomerase [Candidatus Anaplasma sp. TIGMIC]
MKRVSVFGSTGFIGQKSVQILRSNPNDFEVEALVANSNVQLLALQAKSLNAKMVVTADDSHYGELKSCLQGTGIKVAAGLSGVLEASSFNVDSAIMAITGMASLAPVMELVKTGVGTIALASKESMVCGGALLVEAARAKGVHMVPVDSEHNAVFRVLSSRSDPESITITASGGPFLHWTKEQMERASLDDALIHPVWKMGRKISVDSATMVNKALEVIEASYLFALGHDKINVVVHPESIIHGFASYSDGVSMALMSVPDMSIPILYALYWPDSGGIYNGAIDLASYGELTFMQPDMERFPALRSGFDILKSPKSHAAGVVFNAANEVAVCSFLKSEIKFLDIVNIILCVMDKISYDRVNSLGDIIEYDSLSRSIAEEVISTLVS